MEYDYSPIKREESGNSEDFNWKYMVKQTLICISTWSLFFVTGLFFGTPTVMIPQLRAEANSTDAVSEEMASWLSSAYGYSALPWDILLPVLSEIYGRKIPLIISNVASVIGYVIWYFSTNVIFILIAEIILGVLIAVNLTQSMIIITEYSSPKYRGIFLTIKSATFYWGFFVANVIGTFSHWRNILIVALICLAYNFTSYFWPHSPHWLASQGRFEECATAHRLLKGTSAESEKELEEIIMSQKKYMRNCSTHTSRQYCGRIKTSIKALWYKSVYKPIFLSLTLLTMYILSGKLVCNVYALQILKKITKDTTAAYRGMLILDGVSIIGMYIGCYLSKLLKRRVMLFTLASISAFFLFTLSLYLYLIKLNSITDNSTLCIVLLTIFSISISCGPMILTTSIFAEIIPLRCKALALIIIVFSNNILTSTVLKLSPFLFKTAGLHGAFLFYGLSVVVCLLILYKYLPETKDKTLTEIEAYFEK
ncbi:facilitated trehalose transporter Tret1-2 homolog [Amyelois transitella]|uniref:facilitated trehalose transporter Tret1-2 homolog n=1 Tax=Amyelois transitella TaxID=680683 RepID=UPI00067C23B3|nr:facilitated trehalose transporter Tret1-2 homolog [Amyelois transitella]